MPVSQKTTRGPKLVGTGEIPRLPTTMHMGMSLLEGPTRHSGFPFVHSKPQNGVPSKTDKLKPAIVFPLAYCEKHLRKQKLFSP